MVIKKYSKYFIKFLKIKNYILGYTPLLNAAVVGRLNAVVELIKNGADVNKPGPHGFTPLHAAAQVNLAAFKNFLN